MSNITVLKDKYCKRCLPDDINCLGQAVLKAINERKVKLVPVNECCEKGGK